MFNRIGKPARLVVTGGLFKDCVGYKTFNTVTMLWKGPCEYGVEISIEVIRDSFPAVEIQSAEKLNQTGLFLTVFGTCQRGPSQSFLKIGSQRVIEHNSVLCEVALVGSEGWFHGRSFGTLFGHFES